MGEQLATDADWRDCLQVLAPTVSDRAIISIGWAQPPPVDARLCLNEGITVNWPVRSGWRVLPVETDVPHRVPLNTLAVSAPGSWIMRAHGARSHFRKVAWTTGGIELTDNRAGHRQVIERAGVDAHRFGDLVAAIGAIGPLAVHRQRAAIQLALLDVIDQLRSGGQGPSAESWLVVRDWALEHLDEAIDRTRLAALVDVHPAHISRLFRRHAGMGLTAWLRQRRIEWVEHYLRSDRLPLDAIARRCGLGDATWLIRSFKKIHGCTPGQWRDCHP